MRIDGDEVDEGLAQVGTSCTAPYYIYTPFILCHIFQNTHSVSYPLPHTHDLMHTLYQLSSITCLLSLSLFHPSTLTHYLPSVTCPISPIPCPLSSTLVHPSPITYHIPSVTFPYPAIHPLSHTYPRFTCSLSPITHHLSSFTHHQPPITPYHLLTSLIAGRSSPGPPCCELTTHHPLSPSVTYHLSSFTHHLSPHITHDPLSQDEVALALPAASSRRIRAIDLSEVTHRSRDIFTLIL